MLLLVTDTSGRQGSVAIVRTDESAEGHVQVLETAPLAGGAFSAQLVPQIAALFAKQGVSKHDLGALVVVSGPGSFTGLRVGLAAIKALAEILQKPIVAVSLLEVIAGAAKVQGRIAVMLDAGRGDVYFGLYDVTDYQAQVLREETISKTESLSAAKDLTLVTPDAALAAALREASMPVILADPPGLAIIARVGWQKLQAGETVSPDQLEANYMRRSDAELFVKQTP